MLTYMYDFLDKIFAEIFYNWEEPVVFMIGIVLSVVSWIISTGEEHKTLRKALCALVIISCAFWTIYTKHVQSEYTILPQIKVGAYSYSAAETKLYQAEVEINKQLDSKAQEQLRRGNDLYSSYFKVAEMNPQSGTFVKKGSEVVLLITWDDELATLQIDGSSYSAESIYGKVNTNYLTAFNSNEFTLYISETSLKMNTQREEVTEQRTLGATPSEKVSVDISLINYNTDLAVDVRQAFIGDSVTFANVPNGVYYYVVSADGYKTVASSDPFKLNYDSSKEKAILPWAVDMDKEDASFVEPYKIILQDESGIPICNVEATVTTFDKNTNTQSASIPVYSNDEGYLTMWSMIEANGQQVDYYDVIDFSASDNYNIEISVDGGSIYYPVEVENGIGICTVM